APRRAYLQLLWSAWRHDRVRLRSARRALSRLRHELRRLAASRTNPTPSLEPATLLGLLGPAHDAMLRSQPWRPLDEVTGWVRSVRTRIDGGDASSEDIAALYGASHEFFVRQRRLHQFPGAYLVKAFNLAIKGLHYERVTEDIVPRP
ncbi:MAG TPA: hypothetical protein VJN70_01010, partial [Gemmatimonadaceae bacterium]|nr:hypothetical protein [Gemmatimonadaceae bacterium]